MPVLALEWPPNTELGVALDWHTLAAGGFFDLLSRLCTGETEPESLELTVCCMDGRWIAALHGEVEAPRLAALAAFQALRPDIPLFAYCRVVPMKRPLLPRGLLELDRRRRSTPPVGTSAAAARGTVATSPGVDDEARFRSFLRGCPLEREVLAGLSYVRAAHPESLLRAQQVPLSPVLPVTAF